MAENNASTPIQSMGYTIFPGKQVNSKRIFSGLGQEITDAQFGAGRAMLLPFITGFVDYQFPGSGEHRHTGFVYFVRRSRPNNPLSTAIFVDEGEVPAAELQIFPWFVEPEGFNDLTA